MKSHRSAFASRRYTGRPKHGAQDQPIPLSWARPTFGRKPTTISTGPRLYRLTKANSRYYGGPGEAPLGFKRASTSLSEWFWYWASMKYLDPNTDPRVGPFKGGRLWLYQSAELGQFTRQLGTAVIDFLYKISFPYLAVRIQTYRFHLAVDPFKYAYDQAQLVALLGHFDVIDAYEGDFIGDKTGQAAILTLKKTLALQRSPNPITGGTVRLVRSAIDSTYARVA